MPAALAGATPHASTEAARGIAKPAFLVMIVGVYAFVRPHAI
jgi:hypothetical protein